MASPHPGAEAAASSVIKPRVMDGVGLPNPSRMSHEAKLHPAWTCGWAVGPALQRTGE